MKYKLLIILLFVASFVKAQQLPVAIAGKNGVFIWCGHSFAKGFEYQVFMKQLNSWKLFTKFKFPANASEFSARLNETLPIYPYLKMLTDSEIQRIWTKADRTQLIDSLAPYSANPFVMETLGVGALVTGLDAGKEYSFKVVKSYGSNSADTLPLINNFRFAAQKLKTTFKPFNVKPQGKSVTVEFEILNSDRMFDCEVYRSEYQRNSFAKVSASKLFFNKTGKSYIAISDDGVITGSGYSYYVVPIDAMGNTGVASEQINVYNILPKQLTVAFEKYKAVSADSENAIKLSWKLNQTKDIVSIDIFRATEYDGDYKKIMSLSPNDTIYLDKSVKPVVAYFYSIRLNGEYQKSFPSPRIPAILKPNRPNIFPPNNVVVSIKGRIVTICWKKFETDTRGYYVYRGEGFKGEPKQISGIILTDSAKFCYTDTIKESNEVQTYSYAVADVNTSYAISPLSETVSVQTVTATLPVPTNVKTSLQDNKVNVFWTDMVKNYPYIIGYQITRRVTDFDNKAVEPSKTIALLRSNRNYIEDSLVTENRKYYYIVQCIGVDSAIHGSPSQEVACFIYTTALPAPSNLKLFAQQKNIIIQWDEPYSEAVTSYKLYRAEKNMEPVEIATIKAGISEFTDLKVENGKSYYYAIEAISGIGKISKRTDLVGISFY